MAAMQHDIFCIRELIPDFTPRDFSLWGFVKEAVYVRLLPATLVDGETVSQLR
jgi:hypothetical protein